MKITVKDTGVGIKKEDQNKLFKLFGYVKDVQGLNTHGIGLGLVISEKIVHEYGGKMMMNSVYGEGSEFSFILRLYNENNVPTEIFVPS